MSGPMLSHDLTTNDVFGDRQLFSWIGERRELAHACRHTRTACIARHIKAIDSNEALCRVCDDHFNMLLGAGSHGVRRYDEAHAASDDGANSHLEFVILAAISEIQPAAARDNCSARLLYE